MPLKLWLTTQVDNITPYSINVESRKVVRVLLCLHIAGERPQHVAIPGYRSGAFSIGLVAKGVTAYELTNGESLDLFWH